MQIVHPGHSDNVAGSRFIDRMRLGRLNFQQRPHFDSLARRRRRNRHVFLQRSAEDAQKTEFLDKRINSGLEDEPRQRCGGIGGELHGFTILTRRAGQVGG